MRIRKPPRLGLLTHCFEDRRRFHQVVTMFGCFSFDDPDTLRPEPAMWDFVKDELAGKALDLGMPKLRGEVLVHGRACAPGGQPVPAMQVSVAVGKMRKALLVFGDRHWQLEGRLVGRLGISEPESFAEMPLSWNRAFGGAGFAANPLGKGWLPAKAEVHLHPLPNVEPPDGAMTSPDQSPVPAGFAPWELTWPQRGSSSGTYDEAWLAEHAPGLPPDAEWAMFNAAPLDQRIDGFFAGGEAVTIAGMHPTRPIIETRLPRLRPRAFVTREDGEQPRFSEVPLTLETVWLFPHALTGIVAWRGVVTVAEDDGSDIRHLLLAYEHQDTAPRGKAHYMEALGNRLKRGPESAALLKDYGDIAPPERDAAAIAAAATLQERASTLAERIRKRVGQVPAPPEMPKTKMFQAYDDALGRARALLARVGKSPRQHLPQDLVVMSTRGFPMLNPRHGARFAHLMPQGKLGDDAAMAGFIARWDGFAADKLREAEKHFGETGRFAGSNLSAALTRVEREPGEQVRKGQTDIREHILSIGGGVPGMEEAAGVVQGVKDNADGYVREAETLEKMENQLRIAQKRAADTVRKEVLGDEVQELKSLHNAVLAQRERARAAFEQFTYMGAAAQAAKDAGNKAVILRKQAEDAARATLPWAEIHALRAVPDRVVRGQVEIENAMARAAFFDRKTLTGCDLKGLDMEQRRFVGMVLHQVDMRGAGLMGADLSRAIITAGRLANADMTGISLKGATLDKVVGTGAVMAKADLTEARFVDADLAGADFRDAVLENAVFIRCRLDGADFTGCRMAQVQFQKCSMAGLRAAGAHLTRVLFAECDLRNADFSGLRGEKALFVRSVGDGASLAGARAESLRLLGGSRFLGADLTNARLKLAGMVGVRLDGARIDGARLDQSVLMGASLHGVSARNISGHRAVFRAADLREADLRGARLVEANLGKARLELAKLDAACLFAAETMRVRLDKTSIAGTNLLRTRLGMGLL